MISGSIPDASSSGWSTRGDHARHHPGVARLINDIAMGEEEELFK